MRIAAAAALLLLIGCGHETTCLSYELRDAGSVAATGTLRLADNLRGDFTLSTALPIRAAPTAGKVYGSREPNGNYSLQLYVDGDPSRLIFFVEGAAFTIPLAGTAKSYELSRSFTFHADGC